jgi:hypothetical protein
MLIENSMERNKKDKENNDETNPIAMPMSAVFSAGASLTFTHTHTYTNIVIVNGEK